MLENYHTHTARCQHAVGTDREYIEAAIEAGFQILGFSDHCPWIYDDNYVSPIRMRASETDEYFYSLEALRKEYANDIQLFIGFESEYLPSLMEAQDSFLKDYPLDYMILGEHFLEREYASIYTGSPTNHCDTLQRYVDLCIEGMKSGRYRYLAHPDLIYFTGDTKQYEKEMRRLCQAMKQLNKPLELNILGLSDGRNYPDKRFWKIAKEIGNQIILGVDAHEPQHLKNKSNIERAKNLCEGMELFPYNTFLANSVRSK